ncbi:MAG: DinB family protein [Gemmatimonadales bacterium]
MRRHPANREGGGVMQNIDLSQALIDTWRTNNRVTVYLFENLPEEVWPEKVPGAPRRTVRMIAGHIHNCRCMWVKTLGRKHGIEAPPPVDRHRVACRQLLPALERSSRGITQLLELGVDQGGKLSGFPPGVVHFMAYHVAHEGHHRGQIVMLARQLGHRLPGEVTAGLWQWSKRSKET